MGWRVENETGKKIQFPLEYPDDMKEVAEHESIQLASRTKK